MSTLTPSRLKQPSTRRPLRALNSPEKALKQRLASPEKGSPVPVDPGLAEQEQAYLAAAIGRVFSPKQRRTPPRKQEPAHEAGLVATQLDDVVSEETQDAIKAGLVRTQMEGTVSEETQDAIKAGLVRTQMEGTVSEETQDAIKAGLVRTQMEGTVSEETQDAIKAGLADAVSEADLPAAMPKGSDRASMLEQVYREFAPSGGKLGSDHVLALGQARHALGQSSGEWTPTLNSWMLTQMGADSQGEVSEPNFVRYMSSTLPYDDAEFERTICHFLECARGFHKAEPKPERDPFDDKFERHYRQAELAGVFEAWAESGELPRASVASIAETGAAREWTPEDQEQLEQCVGPTVGCEQFVGFLLDGWHKWAVSLPEPEFEAAIERMNPATEDEQPEAVVTTAEEVVIMDTPQRTRPALPAVETLEERVTMTPSLEERVTMEKVERAKPVKARCPVPQSSTIPAPAPVLVHNSPRCPVPTVRPPPKYRSSMCNSPSHPRVPHLNKLSASDAAVPKVNPYCVTPPVQRITPRAKDKAAKAPTQSSRVLDENSADETGELEPSTQGSPSLLRQPGWASPTSSPKSSKKEAAAVPAEEDATTEAQEEAARLAAEVAAKLKAVEEAKIARAKAAEEEAARAMIAEEEAARVKAAEEEAARVKAAEEEAARLAAEEEAAMVKAAEEEAARLAAEEETARLAAEEEAARVKAAEDEEVARLAAEEAETARLAAEEETARLAAEEEAARVKAAEEAEAARLAAAEEEAARANAAKEAEAARIAAEKEATRLEEANQEAARIAAIQQALKQAEEEASRLAAEQQAARVKAAEEEAERLKESARRTAQAAQESARTKAAAEKAARVKAAEEAEAARMKAAEEEFDRVKAAAAAQEAEAARMEAAEEAKAVEAAQEAEAARVKAAEEAEAARMAELDATRVAAEQEATKLAAEAKIVTGRPSEILSLHEQELAMVMEASLPLRRPHACPEPNQRADRAPVVATREPAGIAAWSVLLPQKSVRAEAVADLMDEEAAIEAVEVACPDQAVQADSTPDQAAQSLFDQIDSNHDGVIDRAEFSAHMHNIELAEEAEETARAKDQHSLAVDEQATAEVEEQGIPERNESIAAEGAVEDAINMQPDPVQCNESNCEEELSLHEQELAMVMQANQQVGKPISASSLCCVSLFAPKARVDAWSQLLSQKPECTGEEVGMEERAVETVEAAGPDQGMTVHDHCAVAIVRWISAWQSDRKIAEEAAMLVAAPRTPPSTTWLTAPGEEETARLVAQEEAAGVQATEEEAARLAAEEEAAQMKAAEDVELARLAAEEQAARVAVEEVAAQLAAEEALRMQAAKEEAARLAAEEAEVARLDAEEEAARLAVEEAMAAKLAAAEEAAAREKAMDEQAARIAVEEVAARLAIEEAARMQAAKEAARLAAEEAKSIDESRLETAKSARLKAVKAARLEAEEELRESRREALEACDLEGVVSEETQEAIKAGLVATQLNGKVSEEAQDAIKAGLEDVMHEQQTEAQMPKVTASRADSRRLMIQQARFEAEKEAADEAARRKAAEEEAESRRLEGKQELMQRATQARLEAELKLIRKAEEEKLWMEENSGASQASEGESCQEADELVRRCANMMYEQAEDEDEALEDDNTGGEDADELLQRCNSMVKAEQVTEAEEDVIVKPEDEAAGFQLEESLAACKAAWQNINTPTYPSPVLSPQETTRDDTPSFKDEEVEQAMARLRFEAEAEADAMNLFVSHDVPETRISLSPASASHALRAQVNKLRTTEDNLTSVLGGNSQRSANPTLRSPPMEGNVPEVKLQLCRALSCAAKAYLTAEWQLIAPGQAQDESRQDELVLWTLFRHYAQGRNSQSTCMSHSQYRVFLRDLDACDCSFTVAKADIIFHKFNSTEEGGRANAQHGTVYQAGKGNDRMLEFSEFLQVIHALALESSGNEESFFAQRVIPLIERVAVLRAQGPNEPATSISDESFRELSRQQAIMRNKKQIDKIYDFFAGANLAGSARFDAKMAKKLSFKGLLSFAKTFKLIPSLFDMASLQDTFQTVNEGSNSMDLISRKRFLYFLDFSAQRFAQTIYTEPVDQNTALEWFFYSLDASDGKEKIAHGRSGVMLRPFQLSSATKTTMSKHL